MARKNPSLIFGAAVVCFVLGAFLLLVHMSVENRKVQRTNYISAYNGAQPAKTSLLADLRRGGATMQKKAESVFDGFFAKGNAAASAHPADEAPQRGTDQGPDVDLNAFERFYKENYAEKFESGGEFHSGRAGDRPAWSGADGGSSFPGGGAGGSGTSARWSRSAPKTAAAAAAAAPPSAPAASGPRAPSPGGAAAAPAFGGPVSAGKGRTHAPPPLFASNPGQNDPPGSGRNSGSPAGQSGGSSASGGRPAGGKAGGISGMSGGSVRGGAGGGAAEKMKAGAESGYNSGMGGGVAAAASAAKSSGGSAPAAVAAKSSSGGGDPAGGQKPAKTDAGASGAAEKPAAPVFDNTYTPPAADNPQPEEADLLKVIAEEKLTGKDEKYVSQEEKSAEPMEALLKSGATEGDSANKSVSISTGPADPEDLAKLSPERKAELKQKIHTFLKRVENKYGVMRDIGCTTCRTAPDVCDKYKLKGSYLTMKTSKGATLTISVKYVKDKWRMHTVDFKDPSGSSGKPGGRDTR